MVPEQKEYKESTPSKSAPMLAGKLQPPKLCQVLSRPRLFKLAKLEKSTRLLTICAGAGYGKTTLMAQLAQFHPGAFIWYQIDSLDKDPALFLRHLIAGASYVCGATGARSLERLGEATDLREEGESVLSILVDEIGKNLKGALTIYFDDFHLFEGAEFSTKFINFLVKELPQQVSIVLASRTNPKLSISHLRSKRMISEIGQEDLRFSRSELDQLFHQTWSLEVSAGTINRLYQNSEGWVAGLVLMEGHVKNGDEIPELFTKHKRIRRHVYQYLAEEVLNRNDGFRLLLMQSALIDPIDPDICAQALGVNDSARAFESAERLNMFISGIGDTLQYRLHPLFREFLLTRLKEELDEDDINRLRSRFGQAFEATNDSKKAVEQFLVGGWRSDAIRNLVFIWKEMISHAQYETLERWLNDLGPHDLPPELMICQGELLMAKGKFEQALAILDNAKASIAPKDIELRCHCAIATAECLSEAGRNSEGISELEDLLRRRLEPSLRFALLYRLAITQWNEYKENRVIECRNKAKKLAKEYPSLNISGQINAMSAMLCLRRGDFKNANTLLAGAKDSLEIAASNRNLYSNNQAYCLLMLGRYQEAAELSRLCLETIEEQKEKKWLSVILDTHGSALIAVGEIKKGESFLMDSLEVASLTESQNVETRAAYCHLGTLARRLGDYSKAYEYHSQCGNIARVADDKYLIAICETNMAADLIRLGQIKEAMRHLNNAELISSRYGFAYVNTQIDFHRSWAAQSREMHMMETAKLRAALRGARRNQQNHFIIQEAKICLPMLTHAMSHGIEFEYVSWVMEQIGPASLRAIEPLLFHKEAHIRARVASLLGKIGDANGITLLRRILRDKDPYVRERVRVSLKLLRENIKAPGKVLTNREEQILGIIGTGASNSAIAKQLFISEKTVKTHINKIFRKLGFTNRWEAALYLQKLQNEKNTTFRD